MADIRALDGISFSDWFEGHGGSRGSIKRMWDPIGESPLRAAPRCVPTSATFGNSWQSATGNWQFKCTQSFDLGLNDYIVSCQAQAGRMQSALSHARHWVVSRTVGFDRSPKVASNLQQTPGSSTFMEPPAPARLAWLDARARLVFHPTCTAIRVLSCFVPGATPPFASVRPVTSRSTQEQKKRGVSATGTKQSAVDFVQSPQSQWHRLAVTWCCHVEYQVPANPHPTLVSMNCTRVQSPGNTGLNT